ncbi:MAG: hypothetical protein AAFR46_03090 [Pseudomonadota bacterium]
MSNITLVAPASPGDNPRAHWPEALQAEFVADFSNPSVGSVLVSETDQVRVWHLHLAPGQRCRFHRHVLNYFWTCHSTGTARGWYDDGRIQDVVHFKGETRHYHFGPGEGFTHAVQNVGETELLFTTVEFKESANAPLPLDARVVLAEGLVA